MVEWLVVAVPGDILLLKPADAVLQSRSFGNGPWPRERVRIPAVGLEIYGVLFKVDRNRRQGCERRNRPGLGSIRKITVGEDNDRDHVLDGNAAGFERNPETIARGRWGEGRDRG